MATFPREHLPDRFKESRNIKARKMHRALGGGEGPASRLEAAVDDLYTYSLHTAHLGLPEHLSNAAGIYSHKTVAAWRRALSEAFSGPYFYRLEVGKNGRMHVHVIADKHAGLPDLVRGSELCKPVAAKHDGLPGELFYLAKPVVPKSAEAIAAYHEARARMKKRGKQLPRTSGYVGIPTKKRWQSGTTAEHPSADVFRS